MRIPVDIISVKQLGGTPYMATAIRAHAESLRTEMADNGVALVHWENRAVVAVIKDKPDQHLGIIIWEPFKWRLNASLILGLVFPIYRKGGIYTKLWNQFVLDVKVEGLKDIYGTTKMGNIAMRAVAKKLGRVEESVNLYYRIPEDF